MVATCPAFSKQHLKGWLLSPEQAGWLHPTIPEHASREQDIDAHERYA
jgi:hypothetical protein